MDVILIPGLWLDGTAWDPVVERLESYGLTCHPITIPGMAAGEDPAEAELDDILGEIVGVIDECWGDVLVVGHSAGCGLAYAAVDARPGSISAVAYVGGFPTPSGRPVADGFDVADGVIPFPGIAEFDGPDTADFDTDTRDQFQAMTRPAPGCLATEPLKLTDESRFEVPITMICPEYTAADLQSWIEAGEAPVSEIPRHQDVSYVDLGGGHWPMLTQPDVLVPALLDAAGLEVVPEEEPDPQDGADAPLGHDRNGDGRS